MPSEVGEPTVEVIVRLQGQATGDAGDRQLVEQQAHVSLEPLHPGSSDPELAKFATTRVPRSSVESVVELLSRCAGVDAAYAKPEDALP